MVPRMSNKTYDVLKWIDMVVLPAALTFFGVIANNINLGEITPIIMSIGAGLITFLGTILGISNTQYQIDNIKDRSTEEAQN